MPTSSVSVLSEYRDQGIGSALIRAMLGFARQSERIEKVSLSVYAGNERARQVYSRLGFIEEGRRIRHFRIATGVYDDSVMMYQFVK